MHSTLPVHSHPPRTPLTANYFGADALSDNALPGKTRNGSQGTNDGTRNSFHNVSVNVYQRAAQRANHTNGNHPKKGGPLQSDHSL